MGSSPGQGGLGLATLPPLSAPYFDSSVFMAHIKQEALPCRGRTRFEVTRSLLEDAEKGRFKIYTSFLTISEVRRIKLAKEQLTADEISSVNALFARYLENDWIVPIEVGREVAEKAQEIGARFGMSPTDAIHLASASLAGCNVLLVFDKSGFSNLFKDSPFEGVHVLEPYWEGTEKLATG